MVSINHDIGVLKELLDRFNHLHFPRVLEIKTRVENGKALEQADIDFLVIVFTESQNMRGIVERNPDYKPLVAKISHFYFELTEVAYQNEVEVYKSTGVGR